MSNVFDLTAQTASDRNYWCFISYRHADNKKQDRDWATWLHQEIERYEVPADLVGTQNNFGELIPERIYPVFRDEDSLPADSDLSRSIRKALNHSRSMVVLCSHRAVQSKYVAQEILHFKQLGNSERILAAIIDGEPNISFKDGKRSADLSTALECFPEPLRHSLHENGELNLQQRTEPIAADFRLQDGSEGYTSPEAYRQSLITGGKLRKLQIEILVDAYSQRLQLMKLKILAGILAIPLEQLRNRDRIYQLELSRKRSRVLRLWLAVVSVVMMIAIGAGTLAWFKQREAELQRVAAETNAKEARRGEGRFWLELAQQQVAENSSSTWPEVALFAAKSIGFADFGRPLPRGTLYAQSESFWETIHPLLLDRKQDASGYQKALRLMHSIDTGKPRARPIWRIPSVNHHEGDVLDIALSPDGTILVSGGENGELKYWDIRTGSLRNQIQAHGDRISSIDFSANGTWLASASHDGRIKIWDAKSGIEIATLRGHTEAVTVLAFHPEKAFLASGSRDGSILFWDITEGKLIDSFVGHGRNTVWSLAFNKKGTILASGASQFDSKQVAELKLWDVESRSEIRTIAAHKHGVKSVAFHPEGKLIVTGAAYQPSSGDPVPPQVAMKLWDITTGAQVDQINGHNHEISSIEFDPDGHRILSSSTDGSVRIWDSTTLEPLHTLHGNGNGFYSAIWSQDGKMIVAGSSDHRIWLWNGATGQEEGEFEASALSVEFNPAGDLLAVGHSDGTIKIWDRETKSLRLSVDAEITGIGAIAFSPDGKTLVVTGQGSRTQPSELKLWDVVTGEMIRDLWEQTYSITSVAFSPDGRYLACGVGNGMIRVWSVIDWTEILSFAAHKGGSGVSSLSFSPDSQLLVSGGHDFAVRIWQIPSGEQVRHIERAHQDRRIHAVAFSPDGHLLATAGGEPGPDRPGNVKLWDLETDEPKLVLPEDVASSLAFSPDGTVLATGSWGDKVRLWDIDRGELQATLSGHGTNVSSVAFSPDGKYLATSGQIRMWDLSLGQPKRSWQAHSNLVTSLDISTDGKTLVSSAANFVSGTVYSSHNNPAGEIRVWNSQTGELVRSLGQQNSRILDVALSPNGKMVASVGSDAKLRLWNLENATELMVLNSDAFNVLSTVAWSPNGQLIAAGSQQQGGKFPGRIRVWDVAGEREVLNIVNEKASVRDLAFNPRSDSFAAGLSTNIVKIWKSNGPEGAWREERNLIGHTSSVEAIAYSTDGKLIATGSSSLDGTIRIWELSTGEEKQILGGHGRLLSTTALVFSPDGKLLFSAADNASFLSPDMRKKSEIKIWDVATGFEVGSKMVPNIQTLSMIIDTQGNTLFSGGDDGKIRVWNTKSMNWARYIEDDWLKLSRDHRAIKWNMLTDSLRDQQTFLEFQ